MDVQGLIDRMARDGLEDVSVAMEGEVVVARYRRLVEGGARVVSEEVGSAGWRALREDVERLRCAASGREGPYYLRHEHADLPGDTQSVRVQMHRGVLVLKRHWKEGLEAPWAREARAGT